MARAPGIGCPEGLFGVLKLESLAGDENPSDVARRLGSGEAPTRRDMAAGNGATTAGLAVFMTPAVTKRRVAPRGQLEKRRRGVSRGLEACGPCGICMGLSAAARNKAKGKTRCAHNDCTTARGEFRAARGHLGIQRKTHKWWWAGRRRSEAAVVVDRAAVIVFGGFLRRRAARPSARWHSITPAITRRSKHRQAGKPECEEHGTLGTAGCARPWRRQQLQFDGRRHLQG